MRKNYTCIICPRSCALEAEIEDGKLLSVKGNGCRRGAEWLSSEITDPRRTISSSVSVRGGVREIVSVRLTAPVPCDMIFPIMAEIRKVSVKAPVAIGDVVIHDVLSTGSDVIATSCVLANDE